MKRKYFIFIIVLGCISSMAFQHNNKAQNNKHNSSLDDQADPVTLKLDMEKEAVSSIEAKIRQFLWEHWQEKNKGHLEVTFYSKEGEPSRHLLFIEPNNNNHWLVTVETKRILSRHGRKEKKQFQTTSKSFFDIVERLELTKDGLSTKEIIPDQEKREPQKYALRLRNSKTQDESIW